MAEPEAKPDAKPDPKPDLRPDAKKLSAGAGKQAKAAATAVKTFFKRNDNFLTQLPEMGSTLFSHDAPTRRMSILFFLSLLGLVAVVGAGMNRYWQAKKALILAEAKKQTLHLEEVLKKEAEEAKRHGSFITVGSFAVELKEAAKARLGIRKLNMAEVEVVLLCENQETRDYIEGHSVEVRNQLTNVFVALDREELITREGKRKLKGNILRKMNDWLPHGKIEDVYFSKLLMN